MPQHVTLGIHRTVFLREDGPGCRQTFEVVIAKLDVTGHLLRDRHAVLGNVDRRVEQLGERETPESRVRCFNALHEPADEGRTTARLGAPDTVLRGHVERTGNRHGIVVSQDRIPLRVHGVHLAGRGVVIDQRHDAEVADRCAGGQGNLGQCRRHRSIDGVAALLEGLQTSPGGETVVGDGHRPVVTDGNAGLSAVDQLCCHVAIVLALRPCGR